MIASSLLYALPYRTRHTLEDKRTNNLHGDEVRDARDDTPPPPTTTTIVLDPVLVDSEMELPLTLPDSSTFIVDYINIIGIFEGGDI